MRPTLSKADPNQADRYDGGRGRGEAGHCPNRPQPQRRATEDADGAKRREGDVEAGLLAKQVLAVEASNDRSVQSVCKDHDGRDTDQPSELIVEEQARDYRREQEEAQGERASYERLNPEALPKRHRCPGLVFTHELGYRLDRRDDQHIGENRDAAHRRRVEPELLGLPEDPRE